MRKPVIYRIFGIDREPGLTDTLLGNYGWGDCVRTMTDIMLGKFDMEDIMLTPGLDNLNLLTCGNIPPNPSELLNSGRMTQFLEEIRNEFDVIVIDTPPLLPVTDAAVLGARVDGCVLVYRVGAIARGALKRAKMQLDNVRANVWGVVLNSMRAETSPDLDAFRYQSTYYYGGYAEQADEDRALDLPFYQRWYRRAQALVSSPGREDVREETSTVGRILGAILIVLSASLVAVGFAWQGGMELPLAGSILRKYESVGLPPRDSLLPLDDLWRRTQETAARPAPAAQTPQGAPPPEEKKSEPPPGARSPARPDSGASLFDLRRESLWTLAAGAPSPEEALSESAARRRAAIRLAGQTTGQGFLTPEEAKRPFGISFSVNRHHETTRRQLERLRGAGLSPAYVPVRYPGGTLERVFFGAFGTREEAERFLKERILPLALPEERPFVDRFPYALEVARELAPGEADVIRVIVKAASLHPYFEESGKGRGRMVVGAFRSPSEAEVAAFLLQRERIAFQLVTR